MLTKAQEQEAHKRAVAQEVIHNFLKDFAGDVLLPAIEAHLHGRLDISPAHLHQSTLRMERDAWTRLKPGDL